MNRINLSLAIVLTTSVSTLLFSAKALADQGCTALQNNPQPGVNAETLYCPTGSVVHGVDTLCETPTGSWYFPWTAVPEYVNGEVGAWRSACHRGDMVNMWQLCCPIALNPRLDGCYIESRGSFTLQVEISCSNDNMEVVGYGCLEGLSFWRYMGSGVLLT